MTLRIIGRHILPHNSTMIKNICKILIAMMLVSCSPQYVRTVRPPVLERQVKEAPPTSSDKPIHESAKTPKQLFKVDWHPLNDDALEMAASYERLIFIFVFKEDCKDCTELYSEVFENDEVARLLNTYYVPCVFNGDNDPKLAKFFMDGGSYPVVVIGDVNESYFVSIQGTMSAEEMIKILKEAARQHDGTDMPPAYGNKVMSIVN